VETETRSVTPRTSRLDLPEDWLLRSFGALPSTVTVNADTAMTVATVYACVRILAESVASLPLKLYRKDGDRREEVTDSPINRIVGAEPNQWQTSFEFREMMQGHLGLRGNAYARIFADTYGRPVAVEPLHPGDVEVQKDGDRLVYFVRGAPLLPSDILHIRGISSDGILGLAPVSLLRDTIGLAMSEARHGRSVYDNGARPGGVLVSPANLTKEQIVLLREQWEAAHKGANNSGKTAILGGGMDYKSIGFNNVDSQFLESRKFSVEEIARAYRVPLHLLQSTEKSTSWGTGIEQQNIGFLEYTLRPWLVRWEQALNRALLTDRMKMSGHYFRFNLDALLRGDFKTRAEGYRTMIESGVLSINEVRAKEDWNPIGPEGDQHFRPLNTVPADQLGQAEPEPEPANA